MKKASKIIACALAVTTALASSVYAADIKGHWAESAISSWQKMGYLSFDDNGNFQPDKDITRLEMVILINKAAKVQTQSSISFKDVAPNDPYALEIKKAVAAGYISGFEDGTFKPNNPVPRMQAAKMIIAAAKLDENETASQSFTDYDKIPNWARGSIGAMVDKGYMKGYTNGSFNPSKNMTKAEAVVTLDKVFLKGSNSENTSNSLYITKNGESVKDKTVEGDVIVSEKITSGSVTLKNVKIKGNLLINGGSQEGVKLTNVSVDGNIIVNKDGIKLSLVSGNIAQEIKVNTSCIIENPSETTKIPVTTEGSLVRKLELRGSIDKVTVASETDVTLSEANVANITMLRPNSSIEIDKFSSAAKVDLQENVNISGAGSIDELSVADSVKSVKSRVVPEKVTGNSSAVDYQ